MVPPKKDFFYLPKCFWIHPPIHPTIQFKKQNKNSLEEEQIFWNEEQNEEHNEEQNEEHNKQQIFASIAKLCSRLLNV